VAIDSFLRAALARFHAEESMLDLVYLVGVVALFGVVALVAWGVEKL
jgi:hypothetical protein